MNTYLSSNPAIRQYQLNPVKLDKVSQEPAQVKQPTPESMNEQQRRARISTLRKYIHNLSKVHTKSASHQMKIDEFTAELDLLMSFKAK